MFLNKLLLKGRLHFLNFRSFSNLRNFTSEDFFFKAGQAGGIQKFIASKEKAKLLIKNQTEHKQHLLDACNSESQSLIFPADIKTIVALAETDHDLEILKKLLLKFSQQRNVVPVSSFQFGPEVMRLLYVMNKPSEAFSLVQNPHLFEYFQHNVTILLLTDLLFKNNLYDQVIKTCEMYTRPKGGIPSVSITHYFASCYKLNTEDSSEKAKAVWYIAFRHKTPPLHVQLFLSLLLLNQGLCPVDIMTSEYDKYGRFNCLLENIKYMIFARGNRFQDIFRMIKEVLHSENAMNFVVTEETLSFIEENIRNSSKSNIENFTTLKDVLKEKNFIVPLPLDTFLLKNTDIHEIASN